MLVAVTAMSGERDVRRLREVGFDVHLVKPVAPQELTRVVDTLWRAWLRWVPDPSATASPEPERV